jgi:multidrug resistance efflux pump
MDEKNSSTLTQAPPAEAKAPRSPVARILIVVGVIVAAIAIWEIFFATPKLPGTIVALSGRIEGDDSAVSPKTSGKIF